MVAIDAWYKSPSDRKLSMTNYISCGLVIMSAGSVYGTLAMELGILKALHAGLCVQKAIAVRLAGECDWR